MTLFLPNSSCCHYINKAQSNPLLSEPINIPHPSPRRPTWIRMASTASAAPSAVCRPRLDCADGGSNGRGDGGKASNRREKIIVILGATGSGKSRLSIDLATLFSGEVINSDKMQLYSGLDVTTNKLPLWQRRGVPHHLLGDVDSLPWPEVSAAEYRSLAASSIAGISARRKIPIIAGGSNSFIHALLASRFDPEANFFDGPSPSPVSADLRFNCCFLWVDVGKSVLDSYLDRRVDDMLDSGMFEELAEFFDSEGVESETRTGLRKAIGVPEFAEFFRLFPGRAGPRPLPRTGPGKGVGGQHLEEDRWTAYEEAVRAIKENTCQLAQRQVGKIRRLREGGWDLRRIDATEVFQGALEAADPGKSKYDAVWDTRVLEPSVKIVRRFLEG